MFCIMHAFEMCKCDIAFERVAAIWNQWLYIYMTLSSSETP